MSPARPGKSEIEQRILTNASRYFPEFAGDPLVVRCDGFSEASSYPLVRCSVHRAASDSDSRVVVLKFPPVWPDNVEAETEYRQLAKMSAALGGMSGPLRVPRPLDYFEDWAAVATELVGGDRFSRALLRDASPLAGGPRRRRLSNWVRLCGRWLSTFHQATDAGEAAAFGAEFVEDIGRRVEVLVSHGLPAATARRIDETVRGLARWGGAVPVRVADFHGDFGPQNIHVGNDWVCVFDLSYNRTARVYDDVSYFLVTLETMNGGPRNLYFSRSRLLALRDPFLEGYGWPSPRPHDVDAILAGYQLKALVYRCAKQRRNVAARGRFLAWVFDHAFIQVKYARRLEQQCAQIGARLSRC